MSFIRTADPEFPGPREIEEAWGIRALAVEPLKVMHGAQVVVRGAGGEEWVLKRCRDAGTVAGELDARLGELDRVRATLPGSQLPLIHRTRGGQFTASWGGSTYYLMARVSGRHPDYWREAHVAAVLAAQGRLHACGIAAMEGAGGAAERVPVAEAWERVLAPMVRLEQRLEEARSAGVPAVARPFLPLHRRFVDLAVPLARFGHRRCWPADAMRRVLDVYEAERELEPTEGALLGASLIYPRQWVRSMSSLLRTRGRKLGAARALAMTLRALPSQRRLAGAWPSRLSP